MTFDVLVVGGGTAGCVLAARLSENPDRSVCLLEAGPDYGPLAAGRWPAEILDARSLVSTHTWPGGEDSRTLGGRILGGSSAINACMVVEGSPADYDEWGAEWSYERFGPYLQLARRTLRTAPSNTDRPALYHVAFAEAARQAGLPLLSDADDPEQPVGVGPFSANVVGGRRWNAALAYLEPARERPNLSIVGDTLVDRVLLEGNRAAGVVGADGQTFYAGMVILTAGAYFSPAILLRSGIGPATQLGSLGIPVVASLPVGERLLDHCGTSVSWEPSATLQADVARSDRDAGLFEAHVVVKAASTRCAPGSWDIHVLSWINPAAEHGGYEAHAIVFHMKPLSQGRLRLGSIDPTELPIVERGFLSREEDLETVLEAIELARVIAATEPLSDLLVGELRPGAAKPEVYVRETIRGYYHPAGTCPLGDVVDENCRVLGVDGLMVADASIMPTIPRANTNLTTAAIAERIATTV